MATGIETEEHRRLKRLAVAWASEQKFPAIATEVRLPRSGFRADVAAYRRKTTAVFECKQSRSDFLKDSYRQDVTRQRLKALDERRRKLEELLKLHLPSLRRGEALFAEYDAIHLGGYEHKTYRRVLREIETLQRRLAGKTKFDRLARYRCANLNYLVIEPGILAPEEAPVGWGLLVRHDDCSSARPGRTSESRRDGGCYTGSLVLAREPIWQEVAERDRLRLLENIAAAATRQAAAHLG